MPTVVPSESPTPTPTVGFRCDPPVLDREPSEPFDLVGIVEVQSRRQGGGWESVVGSAKLQACALGGDALVMLYRNERGSGGAPVITGPSAMLPSPELRAAVIRYRRESR